MQNGGIIYYGQHNIIPVDKETNTGVVKHAMRLINEDTAVIRTKYHAVSKRRPSYAQRPRSHWIQRRRSCAQNTMPSIDTEAAVKCTTHHVINRYRGGGHVHNTPYHQWIQRRQSTIGYAIDEQKAIGPTHNT